MQTKTRRTGMLAVLYAAAFIAAFNENIANVALVDIMSEFGIASTAAQWLVTGYMIVTAIVVAMTAFLVRRFTTRALFFAGAICLLVGEVGCYLAGSFLLLMAARLVQAVGSGLFIPLMMNAVLVLAPHEKMGAYLSIGSAAITLGPAFAPVVSGAAATLFGWRAIFAFPLLAVVVILFVGIAFVTNLGEAQSVSLDVLSLALMALGLTLFVFGLGEMASSAPVALGSIVGACVLLWLFGRRQQSLDQPFLDIAPLVQNGRFLVACLLVVIAMMTTFSMSVLLPMYFEQSFGFVAIIAGGLVLPAIIVNAITAIIGGRVMDAHGSWPLLPLGFALIVAGQAAIAVTSQSLQLAAVVAASVVVYAGVGLVMAPSQTAGLKTLTAEQHPSGVSIINTLVMVAASFGPSLFVGVMAAGERGALAQFADVAGTAQQAASQTAAQLAAAAGFSQAVFVAAGIAFVGFIVACVFAWKEHSHPGEHD